MGILSIFVKINLNNANTFTLLPRPICEMNIDNKMYSTVQICI